MKQEQPSVRQAVIKDCKWVYKFICDLEETEFEYSIFEYLFTRNIADPENIYLVAEADELLVGYISCHSQTLLHHAGRVFEIQELYVSKEFRNKGIGQLLIQNLESILSKLDYKSLEVTSNKRRIGAHEFYKRLGFESSHLKFTKSKP